MLVKIPLTVRRWYIKCIKLNNQSLNKQGGFTLSTAGKKPYL